MQTHLQGDSADLAGVGAAVEVPAARSQDASGLHIPPAGLLTPSTSGDPSSRKIYAVVSYKGGVGKSFAAYELAYLFGAVAVDFDYDAGGISGMWGYRPEERTRSALLDAFEKGTTPRPLTGGQFRPDLIPSHKNLVLNQPSPDQVADQLEAWRTDLDRDLIVDTHPGGGVDLTDGAIKAAHVLIVVIPIRANEMRACESLLADLAGYPIILVPNNVPKKKVPQPLLAWLHRLSEEYDVPVSPPISKHDWIGESATRRMACSAVKGRAGALVREEFELMGEAVINYARRS